MFDFLAEFFLASLAGGFSRRPRSRRAVTAWRPDGRAAGLRRALERAPQVPIRDAPFGRPVVVRGELTPRSRSRPLLAPLSGRPCVASYVTVDEEGGEGWYEAVRDVRAADFLVKDETGRVLVRGGRINVVPPRADFELSSGPWRHAPRALEALLNRHAESSTGGGLFGGNRTLYAREAILQAGDVAYVLGQMQQELDRAGANPGGYRDRPKRAVFAPAPEGVVLALDASHPSAGERARGAQERR